MAKKAGVISKEQFDKLDKMRVIRNEVAHECRLWKGLSPNDEILIYGDCREVIQFLKDTT